MDSDHIHNGIVLGLPGRQASDRTFAAGDRVTLDLSEWPMGSGEMEYLQGLAQSQAMAHGQLEWFYKELAENGNAEDGLEPFLVRNMHHRKGVVTRVVIDNGGGNADYLDVELWQGTLVPAISAIHLRHREP